jgi:hypothetical protein
MRIAAADDDVLKLEVLPMWCIFLLVFAGLMLGG